MSSLYRRNNIYWLSFRYHGRSYCISLKTQDRSTAIYLKAKKDQEIAEDRYILRQDASCDKVLKEYMDASQHRKTSKTNKNDESRIKKFLKESGITRINQITEKRLQEYLNHRINKDHLGLSSANRLIATFKAWLNFAVRRKLILENPIRYFKGYNPGEKHPKFLPLEDVPKIMEAAKGTRLYLPILAGLYTGMRVEEVYRLEWQDIDFKNSSITVKHGGEVITKSKKERTIPLPEKLKQHLLPLKKESGRCFDSTNYKHEFPKIAVAAKLKNVTFQYFRHTYASHLIMNNVDLYTVSQLLGHSSVKVTEKHYAHLTKDHKKASVEKLPY
ncbi:MAG: tyrosine-type recombinase/integrase [Candidatus Omnitrophica bacterium]|nr:tyrosine-type recombinase/integrase [Candidatus Omnitrophota bacterium]